MSKRKTYEEFISEYLGIYGEFKYEFDESTYVNTHTPMRFICSKHGEFWKIPKNMKYYGCPKCAREKVGKMCRLTNEKFIKKAKEIHDDKYDYSKVEYITAKTPIKIICPKHGEFWQKPNSHLSGKGCSFCNESHLERKVRIFLKEKGVDYIYQYRVKWLGRQSLDFFIPSLNIAIECQGKQHFGEYSWWNEEQFKEIYKLDMKKKILCNERGIEILYVIDDNMYYSIPENIEYKSDIIKLKNLEHVYNTKYNKEIQ